MFAEWFSMGVLFRHFKGTIISFTYCSFNTFKFKGFDVFNTTHRVVVGEGGGPTFESQLLVRHS